MHAFAFDGYGVCAFLTTFPGYVILVWDSADRLVNRIESPSLVAAHEFYWWLHPSSVFGPAHGALN